MCKYRINARDKEGKYRYYTRKYRGNARKYRVTDGKIQSKYIEISGWDIQRKYKGHLFSQVLLMF